MPFVRIDPATTMFVVDRFHVLGDHLAAARTSATAYEIARLALDTEHPETLRHQSDTYYWLERATTALASLQRRARTADLTILEVVDYDRRMATATDLLASIYATLAATDEQDPRP